MSGGKLITKRGDAARGATWGAAGRLLRDGPSARPTLLLLTAAYALQYVDRMLVGLFAPSIKAELQLSDTQIGLITGVAFSLFYVVASLPLARLADRWDRKAIIVASLAAMSVATAAFGLMGTLAGLFVARACVAIGEAGSTPTSAALLAGLYDSRDRQIAMALYSGGGFAGMAVALVSRWRCSARRWGGGICSRRQASPGSCSP